MPSPIDQFVEKRLSDPEFYPDKDEETREEIAWGIGWKQYKAKHPKWKSKAEKARSSKKSARAHAVAHLLRIAASLDRKGLHPQADCLDRLAAWLKTSQTL